VHITKFKNVLNNLVTKLIIREKCILKKVSRKELVLFNLNDFKHFDKCFLVKRIE
jgi:hypothetical protein